uniref:Non-ribosomal peptide synthetase n=1 Tax=uncultured bacterium esnapd14 TaxID=1366594 RepID=S5UBE8_9BACT|nr:non-ribosomal peptide synthetase [uncultured bacterium esnapd14]
MDVVRTVETRAEPLSSNQIRMWLYCQVLPSTPSFHGPVAVRLKGPLHMAAWPAAARRLAQRHEILRTTFPVDGLVPVQQIEKHARVQVSLVDLTYLPPSTQDNAVAELMDRVAAHGFDFASAPAWSIVIVRLTATEHVLALTAHHMIVDLWSIGLMIDELCALYRTLSAGEPCDLSVVPMQQTELAARQRDRLPPERVSMRQQRWRRHLAGIGAVQLAPARPSLRLATHVFQTELDAGFCEDVRTLCRELGATVYATVFAALAVLITRWCDQTEFAVVSNTSGRLGRDAERVVGTPVEYLIVRVDTGGDPTFRQLAARIGEAALDAFDHLLPLDDMVRAIDPGRTARPSPLRQLGFSVLNTPRANPVLPGLDLSPLAPLAPRTEIGISEGQLWVEIFDTGAGPLGIRWQFGADLFEHAAARQAVETLTGLLADVAKRPDTRLSDLVVAYRPAPVVTEAIGQSTPNSAAIESVKEAVQRVLRVAVTSSNDNFFLLGGGTEQAVALASILSTRWGVNLSALDIETAPTVDGIAATLAGKTHPA